MKVDKIVVVKVLGYVATGVGTLAAGWAKNQEAKKEIARLVKETLVQK